MHSLLPQVTHTWPCLRPGMPSRKQTVRRLAHTAFKLEAWPSDPICSLAKNWMQASLAQMQALMQSPWQIRHVWHLQLSEETDIYQNSRKITPKRTKTVNTSRFFAQRAILPLASPCTTTPRSFWLLPNKEEKPIESFEWTSRINSTCA